MASIWWNLGWPGYPAYLETHCSFKVHAVAKSGLEDLSSLGIRSRQCGIDCFSNCQTREDPKFCAQIGATQTKPDGQLLVLRIFMRTNRYTCTKPHWQLVVQTNMHVNSEPEIPAL